MDSKQIDVMVADASHEVYVDTILDTIREAAKKRGTGIAEKRGKPLSPFVATSLLASPTSKAGATSNT